MTNATINVEQITAPAPQLIRIKRLSNQLGQSVTVVNRAIHTGKIPTSKVGKKDPAVEWKYVEKIKELIAGDPEIKQQQQVKLARSEWKKRVMENVTVNVRDRNSSPYQTILFVGPTNSGKTYHGLEELCADYEHHPDEIHVYCGPLRLLAYEVYQKLALKYGSEKVGFITGEEAINPDAKLIACTVEMAPEEGYSILVDEAHWLTDPDRGHVWSKILVGGKYHNLYILTAAEAVPLIEKLTDDSHHQELRTFTRKTPLNYKGKIKLKDIAPKTAVVCFSRKSVYILARELEKLGKKVGVLYGALPLSVRKQQIEDYLNGVYDIMVTTDVIGHGINLPIDNVVFTQTEKFDGTEIRQLHIWEAAQIAGRAGRYGLSSEGQVYLAEGLPWFSNATALIKTATLAAEGKIATDLYIEKAAIAPRLADLGIKDLESKEAMMTLLPAISAWQKRAQKLLTGRTLRPASLETTAKNTEQVLTVLNSPLTPWVENEKAYGHNQRVLDEIIATDITELWQLVSGPFDERNGVIQKIALWLGKQDRDTSSYLEKFYSNRFGDSLHRISDYKSTSLYQHIEQLETVVAGIAEFKMSFVMFGKKEASTIWLGSLTQEQVLSDEELANKLIIEALQTSIKKSTFGVCSNCGKPTKPWFQLCDSCHQQSRGYYGQYFDSDDEI